MWDFIIAIVGGFVVYSTCQSNMLVGILLALLIIAYLIYRRRVAFSMGFAMKNFNKGEREKAMQWLDRAYKMGMKFNDKMTYAYYLLREGKTDKCEEVLSAILGFRGAKPEERNHAKSTHALVLLKKGRVYEAVEELEEIFPNYKTTAVYGSLGFAYLVQGNMQKAQDFNMEAYDFNSDDAVILDNVLQTHAKCGRFTEAYEISIKLMEKNPTFREAYYDTAVVEYQLGKHEDALSHLRHALTIPTSFLTTVSDDIIELMMTRIENGEAPTGAAMVFLEAKSVELPNVPTLRVRPADEAKAMPGEAEDDDPIFFRGDDTVSVTETDDEPIDFSDAPYQANEEDDEEDSIFL